MNSIKLKWLIFANSCALLTVKHERMEVNTNQYFMFHLYKYYSQVHSCSYDSVFAFLSQEYVWIMNVYSIRYFYSTEVKCKLQNRVEAISWDITTTSTQPLWWKINCYLKSQNFWIFALEGFGFAHVVNDSDNNLRLDFNEFDS